ncbi:hypothetical protein CWI42_121720 [Ordospora colligata]|uniref:Uncharacterized protein n=1 Tax=Ordospora colligata OC4 TaxID=1354746 RepID=A0A0B2UI86_9MICR|nr:uncharacterized protein M896_121720 [Ordospora colligata OC4]KHN68949.1 hypothetical protein M896_121720 [Ordospora colligata OC4]TBU13983.1 hypothetical protein CWI40_121720 [Ordospora colligata]TBU14172.1 hypothetical protein CWI41_121720 [Ordospora colligata]TBU17841.1 hypothetical protein CWI42_121720 [Ordospora colligata]
MMILCFLVMHSVTAIAEYYNQHSIPYEVSNTQDSKYHQYNVESSTTDSDILDTEYSKQPSIVSESKKISHITDDALTPSIVSESKQSIHYTDDALLSTPIKSLKIGKFKANPENISTLLDREMADMSPGLHEKLVSTLAHNGVDRKKYRDLVMIRKRVTDDGKRKVVNLNVKEKIIPKVLQDDDFAPNSDFITRALIGGAMFFLVGLVFTTTLKMYRSIIKKKYLGIDIDSKTEIFSEPK